MTEAKDLVQENERYEIEKEDNQSHVWNLIRTVNKTSFSHTELSLNSLNPVTD